MKRRSTLPMFAAAALAVSAWQAPAAAHATTSAPTQAPTTIQAGPPELTHTITLVTGDIAQLVTAPGGDQQWHVRPSAAATDPGFRRVTKADDTYLLPNSALPYVASGALDRSLFDVTALARAGYDDRQHTTLSLTMSYRNADAARAALAAPAPTGVKSRHATTSGTAVTVEVARTDAAAFWRAMTAGEPSPREHAPATPLAGGATAIQLAVGTGVAAQSTTSPRDTSNANVTVNPIGRDGKPGYGWVFFTNLATNDWNFQYGPGTINLPYGNYLINVELTDTPDPAGGNDGLAVVVQPETAINGDTTVTLDGRAAREITVDPGQPGAVGVYGSNGYGFLRTIGSVKTGYDYEYFAPTHVYTAPSDPVSDGMLTFGTTWTFEANPLWIQTGELNLGPVRYAQSSPRFDGLSTVTLVDAGIGSRADFARVDARGRVAVVRPDPAILGTDQVANAIRAGATAVFSAATTPGPAHVYVGALAIPMVGVPQEQGRALLAKLATGPVTAQVLGVAQSPYRYQLQFPQTGEIPAGATYRTDPTRLATIDNEFDYPTQTTGGAIEFEGCGFTWDPYLASFEWLNSFNLPSRQREYVTANPDSFCTRSIVPPDVPTQVFRPHTSYQPGTHAVEQWLHGPIAPGVVGTWSPAARTEDHFDFGSISAWNDQSHYSFAYDGPDPVVTLSRNGVPLSTGDSMIAEWKAVPEQTPASYQLTYDLRRTVPGWTTSTATHTAWTFQSATPAAGVRAVLPLLMLHYDVPVDQRNRASADTPTPVIITVTPQRQAATTQVRDVEAWSSLDDGATWQSTVVAPLGSDGRFATVAAGARPGQYVSLRVRATDASGEQIDQTVIRAYSTTP